MPLIRIKGLPRPAEKKAEFAQALVRVCKDVLGAKSEDVEILFVDFEPADFYVGGEACTTSGSASRNPPRSDANWQGG
jgi:phenylpyruvate tautomerase PptA (4-oxalocrotonate tautomerase family)